MWIVWYNLAILHLQIFNKFTFGLMIWCSNRFVRKKLVKRQDVFVLSYTCIALKIHMVRTFFNINHTYNRTDKERKQVESSPSVFVQQPCPDLL